MAISFVGSGGASWGNASETYNFSSLLNESGGNTMPAENDIVVLLTGKGHTGTAANACTVTTTGYTSLLGTPAYGDDSDDITVQCFWKLMGATPDTSVVMAANGANFGGAAGVYVFRGGHLTTPFNVTGTIASGTNGVAANAPSITPTTAGSWIIACGGHGLNATISALTNPTGMSTTTNHFRSQGGAQGTTNKVAVGVALKTDWVSGAFDPAAFGGGSTNARSGMAAATLVMQPAAGAAATSFPPTGSLGYILPLLTR